MFHFIRMLHLIVGFFSIQINVNSRVRKPERSGEIESGGDVPAHYGSVSNADGAEWRCTSPIG